jgi:hypothetical protein
MVRMLQQLKFQQRALVQFLRFKSENFMAVNASCQNYLKPVQNVEPRLRVAPLFRVVTSDLTDGNQSVLFHFSLPVTILCFW